MAFSLAGNTITQSGTDTSLSGLSGNGATLTSIGDLQLYDCGVNKLEVTGTLTINNDDTGAREMLVIGNGANDTDTDVRVLNGGTLNIGSKSVQGAVEFSQSAFFPSIFEKDSFSFTQSRAKAEAGQTTLGPAGVKPFLEVSIGGTLNWFGNINCTGGIGFDGVGNDITTPTQDATILIEGGVWDGRRITDRGGVGDQFLYQYSGDLTVDGFTVLSDEAPGLGATIILVEPPLQFRGYRPVMTEAAISGSTTVPLDFVVEIEDYPGVVGEGNVDGIMVASQAQQLNSARATFLNSDKGSLLNLVATQTFAVSIVEARQNLRATSVTPFGVPYTDAVIATENRLGEVFEGRSEAVAAQGTMTLATQPSNGDQFTIDAKTYTLQTNVTNTDGNIDIGTSLASTQQNIVDAINLTGVAGTAYAASMTIHPTVSASAFVGNDMVMTAKTAGEAGNSIALKRSFSSINNVYDYLRMGVARAGSDLSDLNVGRLLLSEWNPDGATTNPPIITTYNPSNTTDDLWSYYLYSYEGENRSRIDVLMRGSGGTELEFIAPLDTAISEPSRIATDGLVSIVDLGQLYDRAKSFKVDNVDIPSIETPLILASGNSLDLGSLKLDVDATASEAFSVSAGTVTITPSGQPTISRVGQTEASVNGPEASSITVAFPAAAQDDDVALLVVGHAESENNLFTTPAGWVQILGETQAGGSPASTPGINIYRRVLSGDSGSVTVTGSFVSGIVAQMIVYRQVNTTTPLDVAVVTSDGASGDPNPASITTVTDGSMVIAVAWGDHGGQTLNSPPAGYSAILDTATEVGGDEGGGGAPTVIGPFTFDTATSGDENSFLFAGPGSTGLATANSNGQWSFDTNETVSGGVGPLSGQGGSPDGYIYTEMSSQPDGSIWTLELDQNLDAATNSIEVEYYWSARGDAAQPVIELQTNEGGAGWVTRQTEGFGVTTINGTSAGTAPWNEEVVDLTGVVSNASTRIRWQITANTDPAQSNLFWHNDVGFDTISVTLTPLGDPGDGMLLATAEALAPTAGVENPGTFDFSGSEEWGTAVVALRVVDTGDIQTNLSPTSNFTIVSTSGDVTIRNGATWNGLTITGNAVSEDEVDMSDVTIGGALVLGSAGTYAFDNVKVGDVVINSDGGGNVTINAGGGSALTALNPGTGNGQVNIVNTVTVGVTVRDAATGDPIPGARVLILIDGSVVVDADTDASGVAENTVFNFSSNQTVGGRARKGSQSPLYKTSEISGTVTSAGFSATVFLVLDE